jgi:hypothetical protein
MVSGDSSPLFVGFKDGLAGQLVIPCLVSADV